MWIDTHFQRKKCNDMSDITKCTGSGCPFKDGCYRYTAQHGFMQSYFCEPPIKDGKCDMYWGVNAESVHPKKEIVKDKE